MRRFLLDLLNQGCFGLYSTNTSCLKSGCPDRSQIGFGIGWVSGMICLSRNFSSWLSSNFFSRLVEQLLLAVVDQLLNPILLSNRDVVHTVQCFQRL